MKIPEKFDAIRPYADDELRQAINDLLDDRQFTKVLRAYMPAFCIPLVKAAVKVSCIGIHSQNDFQKRFMRKLVRYVQKKHTDGVTLSGILPDKNQRNVFITNHRDIVLDSAFLCELLFRHGYPTSVEIAIGDNLLIYPWIERLVKINKCFTVQRSLSPREMLMSSKLMSEYIHFAVNEKRENIWIAQREGRAKDSDDRTHKGVLKMLGMGTGKQEKTADRLRDLNIVPLTISYEYDPCDYLKAKEFQLKRDNPDFKKSRQDDLENMGTGIKGYKGRVNYVCAPCINEWIDTVSEEGFYDELAKRIDVEIHRNYVLYPGNYIACDILSAQRDHADKYTPEDEAKFREYLNGQLKKIVIPNKDDEFLMMKMLEMYANPVRNQEEIQSAPVFH